LPNRGAPIAVRVTVLRYGMPTDLRIEIGDRAIGNQLKKQLLEIAAKYKKEADAELQHSQTYQEIDRILAGYGLTYDDVRHLGKPLPSPAVQKLMALCEKAPSGTAMGIHILLTDVARPDRERVARWLVEEFKKPRASDQLGVRIYEIAVPAIGDELVKIIENRRFGERRGDLCMSLAKVKHKRAAEVIASVLEDDGCTIWAIRCLGKLKAREHADRIRKYLRDREPYIRREAKKTLGKLGFAVAPPPPPVHVVTGRRSIPKGLEEWSANLDLDQLEPALRSLSKCVSAGFGVTEIAEAVGVAENLAVQKTKTLRFPVTADGKKSDVWLVIFMDDEDSPDVRVHAEPAVIKKFSAIAEKQIR
jgi:HEAT repeat protein